LLCGGINWIVARLVYTDMKSIGIEKLAFVLIREGVISSNKDRNGCWSRTSSRNRIIDTRIIISKRESSTKPTPL